MTNDHDALEDIRTAVATALRLFVVNVDHKAFIDAVIDFLPDYIRDCKDDGDDD